MESRERKCTRQTQIDYVNIRALERNEISGQLNTAQVLEPDEYKTTAKPSSTPSSATTPAATAVATAVVTASHAATALSGVKRARPSDKLLTIVRKNEI